jgi:hypothetical protein
VFCRKSSNITKLAAGDLNLDGCAESSRQTGQNDRKSDCEMDTKLGIVGCTTCYPPNRSFQIFSFSLPNYDENIFENLSKHV